MATLDATCAIVSIQNAGVLSACIAVNSGSSSTALGALAVWDDSGAVAVSASGARDEPADERRAGGSPSGVSPMSSGRVLSILNAGPIMTSRNTPIASAAPSNSIFSIISASTGISSPPKCMPDIAPAIASERRLLNQLFIMAIMASQPPSPDPSVMNMYDR